MHGDSVRAGVREVLQVPLRRVNHEVHVHEQVRGAPRGGQDGEAETDVRNEPAVHHVHVHVVRASRFESAQLLAKSGEITGKKAGRELHLWHRPPV